MPVLILQFNFALNCTRRFGSFEIFKARDQVTGRVGPSVGRVDILNQMLDYVTESYYPQVGRGEGQPMLSRAIEFHLAASCAFNLNSRKFGWE